MCATHLETFFYMQICGKYLAVFDLLSLPVILICNSLHSYRHIKQNTSLSTKTFVCSKAEVHKCEIRHSF